MSLPDCRVLSKLKKLVLPQKASARGRARDEAEPLVIAPARVGAATGQAGFAAPERAHAADFPAAAGAMVDMAAHNAARGGEGKIMTALFTGQAEIRAGRPPFGAVRGNAPARMARISDKVRKLMKKRAGQLLGKGGQPRIEQDEAS